MTKHTTFKAEGNGGGDYIEFLDVDFDGKPLEEDMIHLKVGHCCVHYIDVVMPLPVLTGYLAEITDAYEDPWQRITRKVWSKEYAKELADKIIDRMEEPRP